MPGVHRAAGHAVVRHRARRDRGVSRSRSTSTDTGSRRSSRTRPRRPTPRASAACRACVARRSTATSTSCSSAATPTRRACESRRARSAAVGPRRRPPDVLVLPPGARRRSRPRVRAREVRAAGAQPHPAQLAPRRRAARLFRMGTDGRGDGERLLHRSPNRSPATSPTRRVTTSWRPMTSRGVAPRPARRPGAPCRHGRRGGPRRGAWRIPAASLRSRRSSTTSTDRPRPPMPTADLPRYLTADDRRPATSAAAGVPSAHGRSVPDLRGADGRDGAAAPHRTGAVAGPPRYRRSRRATPLAGATTRVRRRSACVVTLFDYAHLVLETFESVAGVDRCRRSRSSSSTTTRPTTGRSSSPNSWPSIPTCAMLLLGERRSTAAFRRPATWASNAARADRVMVMDADNLVYPTALSRLVAALDADPRRRSPTRRSRSSATRPASAARWPGTSSGCAMRTTSTPKR